MQLNYSATRQVLPTVTLGHQMSRHGDVHKQDTSIQQLRMWQRETTFRFWSPQYNAPGLLGLAAAENEMEKCAVVTEAERLKSMTLAPPNTDRSVVSIPAKCC